MVSIKYALRSVTKQSVLLVVIFDRHGLGKTEAILCDPDLHFNILLPGGETKQGQETVGAKGKASNHPVDIEIREMKLDRENITSLLYRGHNRRLNNKSTSDNFTPIKNSDRVGIEGSPEHIDQNYHEDNSMASTSLTSKPDNIFKKEIEGNEFLENTTFPKDLPKHQIYDRNVLNTNLGKDKDNSHVNEVQVEIRDELKITIKLSTEKMKRVEVQVKGSSKYPITEERSFPQKSFTTSEQEKTCTMSLSSENPLTAPESLKLGNGLCWPTDQAIHLRLEHVVHAIEFNKWPVSKLFASADLCNGQAEKTSCISTPSRSSPTPGPDLQVSRPMDTNLQFSTSSRRAKRRRIAIDVEADRAKLQALLRQSNFEHNLFKDSPRETDLSQIEYSGIYSESKPPPAHQHTSAASFSSRRNLQRRRSPKRTFEPSSSSLDLTFRKDHHKSVNVESLPTQSTLRSVTVTAVKQPEVHSLPIDLSARFVI